MLEAEQIFSLGMLFAFAKMQDWDEVDNILQAIDDKVWLATDKFEDMQQVDELLNECGIDIYDFCDKYGIC